jgi:hypothetical protein
MTLANRVAQTCQKTAGLPQTAESGGLRHIILFRREAPRVMSGAWRNVNHIISF